MRGKKAVGRAGTRPSQGALSGPTPATSALMSSVRRRDTEAEVRVRRFLHAWGLRFVLHPSFMPGRPDIVLPKRSSVVFVHGCFWHGHDCTHGTVEAKTNTEFWRRKIADNRQRDARKERELCALGWQVETIWECETRDPRKLRRLAMKLLRR